MIKNKTGVWGEIITVRYLRDRGYKILTTNYSCRFGEIDVIAEKKKLVCFVEVKTRAENPMFSPAQAVDEGKQERIKLTSEQFLSRFDIKNEVRFDVCEVILDKSFKPVSVNYIENAF